MNGRPETSVSRSDTLSGQDFLEAYRVLYAAQIQAHIDKMLKQYLFDIMEPQPVGVKLWMK